MYRFIVEVEKPHSEELKVILVNSKAEVDLVLRKGLSFPDLLMVGLESIQVLDVLRKWYKEKKEKDSSFQIKFYKHSEIGIKGSDEIKNWESKSLGELKRILEG